jgi:hypothetical protein
LLKDFANPTGGRVFAPNNPGELDYYIELIHAELRNQYLLGYIPTNTAHNGLWRRIRAFAGNARVSSNASYFLQTTVWITFVFAAITLKRASRGRDWSPALT